MSGRPLDVLEAAVGEDVSVRLKSEETHRGTLAGYDQHMNLVLEGLEKTPSASADQSPKAADGETPPGTADETESTDGTAGGEDTTIIRGDNVVSIRL